MDVAYARVTYENPFTQRNEASSGRASARFSHDRGEVRKSTNVSVLKEYQLNLNALAQDRAISFADKGKKKEAVKELKRSSRQLRETGKRYEDTELLDKAEEMEQQAEHIEREGMTPRYRKTLRTKSYQKKHQQSKY